MRAAIRRPTPALPFVIAGLAVVLAACGSGTTGSPIPSSVGTPAATTASTGPTSAPVTTQTAAPTSAPTTAPTEEPDESPARSAVTTQTDTEWGRIWDAVPPGYPRYPGSAAADDAGPEPVSLAYAIPQTDAEPISIWMQTAMETATYSTEALSGPLEDGQFVLDSVGDDGCRIETTMAPQGGLILVTVRYGAACPAP